MNAIYSTHQLLFSQNGSEMAIPLIDRHKNLVGYALAEVVDAPNLLTYSFSMQPGGSEKFYAVGSCGKKMHHLIAGDAPEGHVIDHANGDSLDNRRSNLRVVTASLNAQNTKTKRANATSKFHGVSKDNPGKGRKDTGMWRAGIRANDTAHNLGKFNTEEEAAKVYDIWAVYFHGKGAKTNGFLTETEKDWIVANGIPAQFEKPTKKGRDLPEGIGRTKAGGFRFRRIRNGKEFSKAVGTLEEALFVKSQMEAIWKAEDEQSELIRASNIHRNSQGIAYVPVRVGEVYYECLVDDADWADVTRFSWAVSEPHLYPKARVGDKTLSMHRYLYAKHHGSIPKDMSIDHINPSAKLDNRLSNLRLADNRLQGHNRSKFTNNLDRFKGVSFTGHSFMVIIEDKVYGYYETEEDAAYVANLVYSKLYGQNALLNVIPNTRTTKENRLPKEKITREYIESITQVKELKHLVRVLKLNEGNGGPYNLEKMKGKELTAIIGDILSNKFSSYLGIHF